MKRIPPILHDLDRILIARRTADRVERAMVRRHGEYPPVGPRWFHFPDSNGGITSECPDCAPARD